jgi:mttA/Hcf106 family
MANGHDRRPRAPAWRRPARGTAEHAGPQTPARNTSPVPVGYDAPMGIDVAVVLVIVLIVVLLTRGQKTLPRWGQALGRGVRAVRKEADEIRSDIEKRDGPPKD